MTGARNISCLVEAHAISGKPTLTFTMEETMNGESAMNVSIPKSFSVYRTDHGLASAESLGSTR